MVTVKSSWRLERRLLATAVLLIGLPLFAAAANAQSGNALPDNFTDPADIDQAVTAFTGVPIGEVGGARVHADRRLRLAQCEMPLSVYWFGQTGSTLQVTCEGPEIWRIFVATRPIPQAAEAAPIVARGDPITIAVRGRGFTVQQTGEAMENGRVGDWIAIRTERENNPIRARIESSGIAVIPAGQ